MYCFSLCISAVFTNYDYTLYMQRFDPEKKNKMLHSHHVWVKVNTAHDCSSITFMASFNFTNLGCFFAIFSNPRKDSEQFKITIVLVGHLPLHNLAKFNHLSVSENEFYLLPEWLF